MPLKLKLAIEDTVVDKIPGGSPLWEILTTGFRNAELSSHEIADHINQGHPFCAQHQGRRSQANFIGSDVLAVDIDDGMQLDEALANLYVQQHAALLYTTPSHTEDAHRFRIVFQTPRTITDAAEMRAAYTGLIRKFGGDKSCNDACRLFFGSKDSNPVVLGNIMSDAAFDEILTLGKERRVSASIQSTENRSKVTTRRSECQLAFDQEVTLATGIVQPLFGVVEGTSIHCPIHIDRHPSAFVVKNRYEFNGVYCHACAATFWPPNSYPKKSKLINFYWIEGFAREQEYLEDPYNHYDDDAPDGLIELAQAERRYFTFSDQFLDLDAKPSNGVTFIVSPKGSGKTEQLKKIVAWCKANGLSVLLVGHRQSLLISMASRLGITCYAYMTDHGQRNNKPDSYYAICLDSIGKLLETDQHRYDVVLIDEAEQVFTHMTGDTMKYDKRRSCVMKLFHYIKVAKSVIVSDADLGVITVAALSESIRPGTPYRFFLNSHKEKRCPFYLYDSDSHLTAEMMQTIKAGGKHYVATNSLSKAKTLKTLIQQEFGEQRKALLVTSETTKQENVRRFLADITTEILNYDVVIATPTIGTGIDITFPEKAQHIDTVFGFFEACVTTHFDIDQQLSRVRHPKDIKVWVTPRRFSFETEPSVIRRELVNSGQLNDVLIGIKDDGTPLLDAAYLNIYTQVASISRASKNRLRENLVELRKRNGWVVTPVAADDEAKLSGKDKIQEAKNAVNEQRIVDLCSAAKLDYDQYQDLKMREGMGTPFSRDEERSMRRYEIESFYRTDISPELIALDNQSIYRKKVRLMETYITDDLKLVEQALMERNTEKFTPDQERTPLKKAILHDLLKSAGIANANGDINTKVQISSESLMQFAQTSQQHAGTIQELFGLPVRKDVRDKPMQQLSAILNLIGLKLTSPKSKKISGVKKYFYQVDAGSLQGMQEILARRAAQWRG